jgi:hypothetical protein
VEAERIKSIVSEKDFSITVDYIQINEHITKNFLLHFFTVNSVFCDVAQESKTSILKVLQTELESKNLTVLPIIIIAKLNCLFCVPIKIQQLSTVIDKKKQKLCPTPNTLKKLLAKESLKNFLSIDKLAELLTSNYLPTYFEKNFCKKFIDNELVPPLNQILKFEISTSRLTRKSTENLKKHKIELNSDTTVSEIELNAPTTLLEKSENNKIEISPSEPKITDNLLEN